LGIRTTRSGAFVDRGTRSSQSSPAASFCGQKAMSAILERPVRIKKLKVAWHLPGDVIAFLRDASIRLDLPKAWIVAAIVRERIPTLRSNPIQRYPMDEIRPKPVKEAKNRMEHTLREFGS
jgi:hypothetical protein